ncbi:MAG: hypothetical protein SGJ19_22935 [Planctomycetia bacterium]|nr:hypothetical protein [Planctomycetia bacterium]
MSASNPAEHLRLRRELRMEIARRRRAINASFHEVKAAGRRAFSWQNQVARHPLAALATAFGVGWAMSAGLPRRGWLRWLAAWGAKTAFANLPASVWQDLASAFTDTYMKWRKG